MFLPFSFSTGSAIGAAAAAPVSLSGIKTNDVLLALWRQKAGEIAANVAVASFVVADGEIESASVATTGYNLYAIWTHP